MKISKTDRATIKAEAERLGVKYKITATGEVHFYGPLPGADGTVGWYVVKTNAAHYAKQLQAVENEPRVELVPCDPDTGEALPGDDDESDHYDELRAKGWESVGTVPGEALEAARRLLTANGRRYAITGNRGTYRLAVSRYLSSDPRFDGCFKTVRYCQADSRDAAIESLLASAVRYPSMIPELG